jgi:hypothetical protein
MAIQCTALKGTASKEVWALGVVMVLNLLFIVLMLRYLFKLFGLATTVK